MLDAAGWRVEAAILTLTPTLALTPTLTLTMEGAFKRPPMDEGDTRSAVGLWRGEPAQPLIHHPVWRQAGLHLRLRPSLKASA